METPDASYHTKLQEPATRIGTPISCNRLDRLESDSLINRKTSGATANGRNLWMEVAALAHVREDSFQNVSQFYPHLLMLKE